MSYFKGSKNQTNFSSLLIFLISIITSVSNLNASVLSGTVSDEQGAPLPFATLYVNQTTNGTTTNIEGKYTISLAPGSYEIVYQYVGYKKKIVKVEIGVSALNLDVSLESETLQLKEIVVTSNKEDPAYAVIRAAIKKRKYHLDEVEAYRCNVYIKGIQTLSSRPDKVFGYVVPVDTGIVYLSESISELSVAKPDKIKETMISSKVSGNITTFSYNQGSQMLFSFYDNLVKVVGLSERSFVSPIASNALLFYEYKLAGVFEENGYVINKIKVIPKRKNDPVFEGYIYIIEDLWRIHSTNLVLTSDHQIEFMNRMTIDQVYAPVEYGIWMMISQSFNYDLDTFGFKGEGNFIGVYSNYQIEPNLEILNAERRANKQIEIVNVKQLFGKKYFNNEMLSIEDEANKKSNEYWDTIRPVPLTALEMADYQKNDSLKTIYNSRAYKDSVDKYVNKISFANILYSGYTHQNSFHEKYFSFDPIIKSVLYNTVEGLAINFRLHYTKYNENILKHSITPEVRYGFSSENYYGQIRGDLFLNPKKYTRVTGAMGHYINQINDDAMPPFVNTMETLLRRNNFMKLYEKTYLRLGYRNEVKNGFLIDTYMEYADRKQLYNQADFSFFYRNDSITSNQPVNDELLVTSFKPYQALFYFLKIRIDFDRKYITRPDNKIALDTKYPRLEIYYKRGIPLLGSDVNYDNIMAAVAGEKSFGLFGITNYTLQAGTVLNKSNMRFPDYVHFNTNQSVLANFSQYRYELLDYYKHSTTSRYYILHLRHHFNGFIINKIPLIRKTKAQMVASFSYLNTVSINYYEYGLGLEHLVKLLQIGVFTNNDRNYGIRIGYGF